MLSVDEALRLVLEFAQPSPAETKDLPNALGCVLAEDIASDIDSPPHDKSIVDGYALIAAEVRSSGVELAVLEEITAGALPTRSVESGNASRIMTGAPLPPGADAVVMVEQTRSLSDGKVQILQSTVRPGQNIMRRGAAMVRGQTVFKAGKQLRAIELGLLAEVGRDHVKVQARPSVAVIATGNELVETSLIPAPGQIRNSNGPLLMGLVEQTGSQPVDQGIARDTAAELRAKISNALAEDVVVLSGGVSAGVLDLVPQVLAELGVEQVFHKVNLKPGKPLWFGVKRHDNRTNPTLVFGLPGNPVSTLVCFELFVRPALQKLRGLAPKGLPRQKARLAREHQQRGERPTYWPAEIQESGVRGQESEERGQGSGEGLTPLKWQGSGDLRTLAEANCLAFFPAGDRLFAAGEEVECLRLPGDEG